MKKAGCLGFPATITLIFIIAKLFGLIDWSWWLVLFFVWVPVAVVTAIILLAWLIIGGD